MSLLETMRSFALLTVFLIGCNTIPYPGHERISAAKAGGFPMLLRVTPGIPGSAGAVDLKFSYLNLSGKPIKHITVRTRPRDKSGELVTSHFGDKGEIRGEVIGVVAGPIPSDELVRYARFENIWFDSRINCIEILSLSIQFVDQSRAVFMGALPEGMRLDADPNSAKPNKPEYNVPACNGKLAN